MLFDQQQVNDLFDEAVELAGPERVEYLELKCAGNRELRAEVESLLAADADLSRFIENPILSIPPEIFPDASTELTGQQLGSYRIVREIGRGGLGRVYLAERADDAYRKQVAIKLIRRGLDTEDILSRFRNERQILAQLDHPNIARLLDGGTTAEGLPFFVMEYVAGESLLDYCESHRLSTNDRLELFRKICAAVTYAHQNLVIHRDLKPSNILVTAEGEPELLDFGIARLLTAEDEDLTLTAPAARVLTPGYASPEQIRGDRITTASDVYSLGVLLYEMLSGHKPYRLKSGTSEEMARAIAEQEPERPSTAAARQADHQPSTISHQKFLRGDLDNIVLMALRKEPERRYISVERFSEDIRRHLEGRPVLAHKDTFAYRATKFARRNRIGVAAAAIVLLTLMGGIVATGWQAKRATEQAGIAAEQARVASAERDRAQRESAKAQSINTFLQNILGFSDPTWLATNPRGNAHQATIADAIDEAARRAETELADQPEVLAAVQFSIGRIYETRGRVDRAEALLRSSLDIRRRVLGPEHLETAQSMQALGEQCILRGKTAEAGTLLRDAVTIFRRTQNQSLTDLKWLAIALSGLGSAQVAKGDAAEGERLLLESLEASDKLLGGDRNIIPILLHNLGHLRGEQGDVDGAIAYLKRAVEEFRRSSADLRFHIANSLSSLGSFVARKGEHAQAELLLRESIGLFRDTIGEESQKATLPMIALANVHYLRGDFPQAREAIDHVIGIQQRVLTEGHVDFSNSWLVLGKILTRTGEAASGETYLRKALELRGKTYAKGHWRIAEVQMALGESLRQQARLDEAERVLVASHSTLTNKLGPGDPRTQEAQRLLGELVGDKRAQSR